MKIYIVAQSGPYRKILNKILAVGLGNHRYEIKEIDHDMAVAQLRDTTGNDIVIIDMDFKYFSWRNLFRENYDDPLVKRILLSNDPEDWISDEHKRKYSKVLVKPFEIEEFLSTVLTMIKVGKVKNHAQ